MKKTILLFAAFIIAGFTYAQTNNGFSYKALLTDNGEAVANALISVKATFYDSSDNIKWQEEHVGIHTDESGIFSISLGEGTRLDGATTFSDIYWGVEGVSLSIEVDTGSGYTLLVDKEPLKSVPYTQVASKIQNEYFTNRPDGSLRFYVPGVYGGDYIKYGTNGMEMGDTSFIFGYPDVPYFKANENTVWIKGELNTEETGDANMVPIAYGYINDDGSIIGGTDNFTVTNDYPGEFLIKLNNVDGLNNNNTILIGTPGNSAISTYIRAYVYDTNRVYFKTRTDSAGETNMKFYFLIYKK